MRIGVPKEIKNHEYRVGLTPAGARELVAHGHDVLIETGAGREIGLDDGAYRAAGAAVAPDAATVFDRADLIVKVKEPQAAERARLRAGQTLFTYLHLAPDPEQTADLLASGVTAIAYETVSDDRGGLPLLAPMSEIAGRMAAQAGAHCLEKAQGGRGVLLGGAPGVPGAKVVVLGGGVVGSNAARMAAGLGAQVTIVDKSPARLRELDALFAGRLQTAYATAEAIEALTLDADLVVGAALIPGAAAPRLITRAMVERMKRGAAIVDVAIDQGGCCETSHPTTHADPTYIVCGVVHYCVANMPGGVARTSTFALTNATLPYVLTLADKGTTGALRDDPHLRRGLNVHNGALTCAAVAAAQNRPFIAPETALAG